MSKSPRALTPAEWTVIKCVWENEPCTAPIVQHHLHAHTGWTYSTVRTIMDRMAAKGLLKAQKSGKLTLFQAAITRQQAQTGELLSALKKAFNGALTPMVQCLLETRSISAEELAELENMIKARRKGEK